MRRIHRRILNLLGDDHATAGQIATALGMKRAEVLPILHEMDRLHLAGAAIRVIGDQAHEFWVSLRETEKYLK